MPESVHELTAAMAAGDPRAVERFYRQWFDFLYAQAARVSGRDESFCLDVVQDAVLRVIRSVRPASTETQLKAWLRLVVQTTAYDLLRAEARLKRRELAVAACGTVSTLNEELDAERLAWLRTQLDAMDPKLGRMIEMRFERHWTLARVARAMGLTVGTVDGRLRRALHGLRRRALEYEDD